MIAVRSAVAPVAQALATLYTGMPVWPICFCNCCPIPAFAAIRFPAAMTPMSAIVTPASASAPVAASAARSTVSLSGCLPNLVIRIPRIQMSSLALIVIAPLCSGSSSRGFEAEADRLGACRIGADRISSQPHFHPVADVLRVGLDIDQIGTHLGAVAVDYRRDERGGNAGCGKCDDGERPQCALGRDRNARKFGGETTGA